MLLFNEYEEVLEVDVVKFKNILCYCSTSMTGSFAFIFSNLKTSYVIVQLRHKPRLSVILLFKNILCYCSTVYALKTYVHSSSFKNILCYCSTPSPMDFGTCSAYLKTSYVIVQLRTALKRT